MKVTVQVVLHADDDTQTVVRGVSPLIWRRLLIPADTTIADSHAVLQAAFGWTGTHLHRFVVQGREVRHRLCRWSQLRC